MDQPQQPVQHPHGAPWYLVIILIVIALGASVAAIWFGVMTNDVPELAETMTEEVVEEVIEEEMDEEEESEGQLIVEPGEGEFAIDEVYEETAGLPARTTALFSLARQADDVPETCEYSYVPYSEAFTAEAVVGNAYVPGEETDRFVGRLVEQVERLSAKAVSICDFNGSTYVLIPQISGYGFPFVWNGRSLTPFQPVAGVMDSAAGMTDQLVDGEILVSTGYGDAGHMWWSYYRLDPDTRTTELIESCSDRPLYDDEGNWVEGERQLQCRRVWEE